MFQPHLKEVDCTKKDVDTKAVRWPLCTKTHQTKHRLCDSHESNSNCVQSAHPHHSAVSTVSGTTGRGRLTRILGPVDQASKGRRAIDTHSARSIQSISQQHPIDFYTDSWLVLTFILNCEKGVEQTQNLTCRGDFQSRATDLIITDAFGKSSILMDDPILLKLPRGEAPFVSKDLDDFISCEPGLANSSLKRPIRCNRKHNNTKHWRCCIKYRPFHVTSSFTASADP